MSFREDLFPKDNSPRKKVLPINRSISRLSFQRGPSFIVSIFVLLLSTALIAISKCAPSISASSLPLSDLDDLFSFSPGKNKSYKLVFQDEFEGERLDLRKWYHLVDCSGRGNKELQCYTNRTSNVRLQDGLLVIEASKENYNNRSYTSGRVHASGKGWTYGKFVARARLPSGKHLWPAIWLVPTNGIYGPWPQSGEIDIMEARGQNTSSIEGTVHFGQSRTARGKMGSAQVSFGFDFSKDFHIFAFEWTRDFMAWSVDGMEFFKISTRRSFNVETSAQSGPNRFYEKEGQPFDQNFKWILNVAIGGVYFSNPIYGKLEENEAEQWLKPTLEVDYVRVYQETERPTYKPVKNATESPLLPASSSEATTNANTSSGNDIYKDKKPSPGDGDYKDVDHDYPNYVDDYYYFSEDSPKPQQDTYYYNNNR